MYSYDGQVLPTGVAAMFRIFSTLSQLFSHLFSPLLNSSQLFSTNRKTYCTKQQVTWTQFQKHKLARHLQTSKAQRETSVPLRPLPEGFRAKAVIPPTALQPSLLFPAPWHPFTWRKTKFQVWFLLTSSKPFTSSFQPLLTFFHLFATFSQPLLNLFSPILNLLFLTSSSQPFHSPSLTSSQPRLNLVSTSSQLLLLFPALLCSALLPLLFSYFLLSSPLLSSPLLSSPLFSSLILSSLLLLTLLYSTLLYSTLLYSTLLCAFLCYISTLVYCTHSILLYFMLSWPYFIRNSVFLYEPSFDHTYPSSCRHAALFPINWMTVFFLQAALWIE